MLICDKINSNVKLLQRGKVVKYEIIKVAYQEVLNNTKKGIVEYDTDRHMFGTFSGVFRSELLIYLGFKGNPYKPNYHYQTATTVLSDIHSIFTDLVQFKPVDKLITDIWFPISDRQSRLDICDYYLNLLNKK